MRRYQANHRPLNNEQFIRQLDGLRLLLHSLAGGSEKGDGDNVPPLDMFESGGAIVLEIDLPGFSMEDISVALEGLTLSVEAFRPKENVEGKFICMERACGRFRRTVHLPGSVDASAISADYSRGVLRITCPAAGGRAIPIKENNVERIR